MEGVSKPKVSGDRNQCAGCGELFNSTAAFDKHRTGEFGSTRRCRTTAEMHELDMEVSNSGYWVTSINTMFNKKGEVSEQEFQD